MNRQSPDLRQTEAERQRAGGHRAEALHCCGAFRSRPLNGLTQIVEEPTEHFGKEQEFDVDLLVLFVLWSGKDQCLGFEKQV